MPTIADVDRQRLLRFRRSSSGSNSSSSNSSANEPPPQPRARGRRRRHDSKINGEADDGEGDNDDWKRPRLAMTMRPEDEVKEPLPGIARRSSCASSSSCSSEKCVRHFAYAEVLLHPQLLYELRTEEGERIRRQATVRPIFLASLFLPCDHPSGRCF